MILKTFLTLRLLTFLCHVAIGPAYAASFILLLLRLLLLLRDDQNETVGVWSIRRTLARSPFFQQRVITLSRPVGRACTCVNFCCSVFNLGKRIT